MFSCSSWSLVSSYVLDTGYAFQDSENVGSDVDGGGDDDSEPLSEFPVILENA